VTDSSDDNQWHLDKRVPVTLIVVLLVQLGAWIWSMALIRQQVNFNADTIVQLTRRTETQEERLNANTTAVAVANETLRSTADSLLRIDRRLERIERRLNETNND